MKKSNKWLKAILICGIIMAMISGCHAEKQENTMIDSRDVPEELDIFLVGDAVHSYKGEEEEKVYYTTMVTLGDFNGNTEVYGEEGFIFYDAFKKYEEKTGIKLNLHWYPYPESMEADLQKLDSAKLPDLILTNMTSKADYAQYMKNGMFYDLSEWSEEEGLYEGKYYEPILKAGQLGGKQYILPFMFNIDVLMGSEESMKNNGLYFESDTDFSGMMEMILQAQQNSESNEVVGQYVSYLPYYTPHILYAASGEKWIDYETGRISLDEKNFSQIANFYKEFLREQFTEIPQGETISWAESKHVQEMNGLYDNYTPFDAFLERKGCIIEGGSGYQTELHSAAAQVRYYESRYKDMGEEFSFRAIPSQGGGITAQVAYFGGVLSTSSKAKAAYDFLRFLMDEEWFYHFGMSVNIENNEKQLEELANSEYTIRPGLQKEEEDGTYSESYKDYVIQPMSKETKEKIKEMIEDIDRVTLPNWAIYECIRKPLESYSQEEMTLEEAYKSACQNLEEYLKE